MERGCNRIEWRKDCESFQGSGRIPRPGPMVYILRAERSHRRSTDLESFLSTFAALRDLY